LIDVASAVKLMSEVLSEKEQARLRDQQEKFAKSQVSSIAAAFHWSNE